jgi:hypothetical protein
MKKYIIANTADLTTAGFPVDTLRKSVDQSLCIVESEFFPAHLIVAGPYTAEEIIPLLINDTWIPNQQPTGSI